MTRHHTHDNWTFERMEDGSVQIAQYKGDPLDPNVAASFRHVMTAEEWDSAVKEVSKTPAPRRSSPVPEESVSGESILDEPVPGKSILDEPISGKEEPTKDASGGGW